MKVLLVNGSPHKNGCTYTALCEVERELQKAGIETEIFYLGTEAVRGCTACGGCSKTQGHCVLPEDIVNVLIDKAKAADGFVFGSPVHYAGVAGTMHAVLDRAFFAGSEWFAYKPGAAVVSCRRAGSTAAFDSLNKYFTISNMPVVSSQYWCMVHGTSPQEVYEDKEGMQIMRTLGKNMAWLLRCIQLGKENGILIPAAEEKRERTNFIH